MSHSRFLRVRMVPMSGLFLDFRKVEGSRGVDRIGASELNSELGSVHLIFKETLRVLALNMSSGKVTALS